MVESSIVSAGNADQVSNNDQIMGEALAAEYIAHCKKEDTVPIDKFSKYLETVESRDKVIDVVMKGNSVETFEKRISSVQAVTLFNYLKLCRHLRKLDLSYNQIDDTAMPTLLDLVKVCSSVTDLNLGANSICETGGRYIAQILCESKCLSTLDLSWNAIGEPAGQEIGMALFQSKAIQKLNLRNCEIGLKTVITIMQAMSEEEVDIRDLNIESAQVSWNKDEHIPEKIGHMLAKNSSLRALNLGKLAIADRGVKEIVEYGLIRNTTIVSLNLKSNNIGVDGARYLVRWLSSPSCSLQELDLSSNRIGNKGVRAISECLKLNSSLKSLNLANNRLSSSGLLDLASGIQQAGGITQISLWPSDFDHLASRAFLALSKARPAVLFDFIPYENDQRQCYVACISE